jgi:glycosyltransferase involved in cell wall biosynthesis
MLRGSTGGESIPVLITSYVASGENGHKPGFSTTINYLESKEFAERVRTLVRRPPPGSLRDGLRIFWRVVRTALNEDRLLLSSSWGNLHPELLAAAFVGLLPRRLRPSIYLLGCMWEPDRGMPGILEKQIIKLADRTVDLYIVQSTEEVSLFPPLWGVAPGKVRFCPFFYSLRRSDLQSIEPIDQGVYIFSGGNSMRDYEPVVEAARRLPERKFIMATKMLDGRNDLPPNMLAKSVSHKMFISLLYHSSATIVPVKPGLHRAAGQQTYLNSMWLGKPTIVTDTLGVHDHIRDKETGLIVDGSASGYVNAINWIFNPNNGEKVARLNAAARHDVEENFSFQKHIERLLKILDEYP